jgi:hypothetical protein
MLNPPFLLVQDNFLLNPNQVREIGLAHCHELSPFAGRSDLFLRGLRGSKALCDIDEELYSAIIWGICKPVLGNLFLWEDVPHVKGHCEFQLTDSSWSTGWVHLDLPYLLTSVLYLSPNADPDSGTCLYELKNPNWDYPYAVFQKQSNASPDLRQTEEYIKKRDENNAQFVETASVKNVYNRMVTFPASTPHAGHYYFGEGKENSRLALVTLISDFGPKFA